MKQQDFLLSSNKAEGHTFMFLPRTCTLHLSIKKCRPRTAVCYQNTHTKTDAKVKMSQPVDVVSSECQSDLGGITTLMYKQWLNLSRRDGCPLQGWYALMPGALHKTTTDPQPAAKSLHFPLSHFHLIQPTSATDMRKRPTRIPWRQTGATISTHVNMQHLQIHCCENPLKMVQLPWHTCWERSFFPPPLASKWMTMACLSGASMHLTWESKTIIIREQKESEGEELMGGKRYPCTNTMQATALRPL